MAVTTTTNRNDYTADGTQTVFAYTFKIFQASDLDVYVNGALQDSGYTVSGAGNPTGGNVTFTTAPASGSKITLIRDVPYDQQTVFVDNDKFPADSINNALDKLTILTQQLLEKSGRAVSLPVESTLTGVTLPTGPSPSGKLFRWNSAANNLELVSGEQLGVFVNPVSNKGDLLTHDGTITQRLPVGPASAILTADPTQPSGLKWGTTLTLADQGADPTVAGELLRNGAHLKWHDGTAAGTLLTSRAAVVTSHPGPHGLGDPAPARFLDVRVASTADTRNQVRVRGYQASFEVFNEAATANFYFGVDDADGNKLKIGPGYSPAQGLLPYITVQSDGQITFNNAAAFGSSFNFDSPHRDTVARFRRASPDEALIVIEHRGSGAGGPLPILTGMGYRGTLAAPAAVQANDNLFVVDGRGFNGTEESDTAAQVVFQAEENFTPAGNGARIVMRTAAPGQLIPIERFRLTDRGLGIGGVNALPGGGGPVIAVIHGVNPTAIPSGVAGIFAKMVGGVTKLFAFDSAGNFTQLTP